MSDEYQTQSLDALLGPSPEIQAEPVKEPPQAEEGSDEVTTTETTEETVVAKVEEKSPETAEILRELETIKKRHKDTQQWGNEANQKYLKAQERLHELGEISDEELVEARKTVPGTQDEMKIHVDEFFTRYNIVKDYIKEKEGSDPDSYVEAFKGVYGNDQTAMQEFAKVPADKKVSYVLEKGREVIDLHQGIQKYGSVAAALAEIRKSAAESALEGLKVEKKKTEKSDEETVKAKPRLSSGAGATSEAEYQPKSINQLLE